MSPPRTQADISPYSGRVRCHLYSFWRGDVTILLIFEEGEGFVDNSLVLLLQAWSDAVGALHAVTKQSCSKSVPDSLTPPINKL